MPERAFIVIPSSWLFDPALQRVSDAAFKFFVCFFQNTDWHGRFSDDPLVLKSHCLALNPDKRVAQVILLRDELVRAGCLTYRSSLDGRRCLEVAEHLRYRRDLCREPRWGPTLPRAPEQPDLAMGPLVALPPPAANSNQRRIEKEKDKTRARQGAPRAGARIPPHYEKLLRLSEQLADAEI